MSSNFKSNYPEGKISFLFTTTPSLVERLKAKYSTVSIYSKYVKKVFTKELKEDNSEEFISWVDLHTIPPLDDINTHTFKRKIESKKPIVMFFFEYEKENKKKMIEMLEKVVEKFYPDINFVYSDSKYHKSHVKMLGGKRDNFPTAVLQFFSRDSHYLFPDSVSFEAEKIVQWINAINKDLVPPSYKSVPSKEEIDKMKNDQNDEKEKKMKLPLLKIEKGKGFYFYFYFYFLNHFIFCSVVDLLSDNWHQIVLESRTNVVVNYFVPWCDICRTVEEIWKNLAKKYENSDIIFARCKLQKKILNFPFTHFN